MLLEVCIDSVEGALAAAAGGAQRVELCIALELGGLTPTAGLIQRCRGAFPGTLMVMLRPRGGDFVYTEDEVQVMLEDCRTAAALGADGVVFGCLAPDGTVHVPHTQRLWAQAKELGLDATFHRAFDMVRDPAEALEALMALGLPRVLTSGCAPTAPQGADVLADLVRQAAGRIVVLAGGGVTPANAAELVRHAGVAEVHSTAKRRHQSAMVYRRPGMSMVSPNPPLDYEWNVADPEVVKQLVGALRG